MFRHQIYTYVNIHNIHTSDSILLIFSEFPSQRNIWWQDFSKNKTPNENPTQSPADHFQSPKFRLLLTPVDAGTHPNGWVSVSVPFGDGVFLCSKIQGIIRKLVNG